MLTDNIIRGLNSSHLNSFPINFPTFNNLKNVNQCSWRVTQEHWSHLFLTQKHFTCSLLLNRKSLPRYSSHLKHQLTILDFFILRHTAPNVSGKLHFVALLGLLKFHCPWRSIFPMKLLPDTSIPGLPPLILLINNFLRLILLVLIYMSFTTLTFISLGVCHFDDNTIKGQRLILPTYHVYGWLVYESNLKN